MDPTPETEKNLVPPYEADTSYLICRPEGETLMTMPQEPVEDNMATEVLKGKVDKEGNLVAELKAVYTGINDTNVRGSYLRAKDEEKKQMVENLLGAIFGAAELFDYEITPKDLHDMSEPFTLTVKFKVNGLMTEQAGAYVLKSLYSMAAYSTVCPIILSRMDTSLDKRRFPMKMAATCGVECYSEIDLSDLELKDFSLPEYPVFDTPEIFYKQTVAVSNDVLIATLRQESRKKEMPAEAYDTLKNYKKFSQSVGYKRVFAKKAKDPYKGQHVLIVDDDFTYEVVDETTVKTKSVVTKKILDYAGKKANSELHFYYCPQNTEISLTNMYVELEDGTIRRVVDSEINIMDADWKASAPRYPDIKHIVVTLPGTDIGTTVHYECERVTKDLPLMSGTIYFEPGEPILHRRYAVVVPSGMKLETICNDTSFFFRSEEEVPNFVISDLTDGRKQYLLELSNLTNIVKRESNLVPSAFRSPMRSFICEKADESYLNSGWKNYAAKLQKEVERATTDQKEVEAKVKEITEGRETLRQKVIAIRDFIEINVREDGPSFASLPLSAISDADQTLKDCYGNDFDRAVLFYAMLKDIGFNPSILLASSLDPYDFEQNLFFMLPQTSIFGGAYVEIYLNGKNVYLNCGSQYDMLETMGPDRTVVLDLTSGAISLKNQPEEYALDRDTTYEIEVADDLSATISRASNFGGSAYGALVRDVVETLPEMQRREELQAADGIARGAVVIENFKRITNGYPGLTTIKVKTDNYIQKDGDTIYLRPFYSFNMGGVTKPMRIYPFYTGGKTRNKTVIKVTFPKEYTKAVFMPQGNFEFPGQMGYMTATVEHEEGSSQWTITYRSETEPTVLDQEQYHQLYLINKRLSSQSFNTIAVTKETEKK